MEITIDRLNPRFDFEKVLASPCTRRLVHETLALTKDRDIVDCINDLEMATAILEQQLEDMKGAHHGR